MASIQILSSPCYTNQLQIDEKEKFMDKLKLSGKVPANVLLLNPYETYKSYFDKNQKQLDALIEKYKANNCASDTETKQYNRDKCLQANKNIEYYTAEIANWTQQALNNKKAGSFDANMLFADNLRTALDSAKKDFIKYGCEAQVEASRQEVVAGISKEYSAYDKARIQAESIYERNKRVFFGAVVLVGALALIMTITNSKAKN
jgi:hypothetical protein